MNRRFPSEPPRPVQVRRQGISRRMSISRRPSKLGPIFLRRDWKVEEANQTPSQARSNAILKHGTHGTLINGITGICSLHQGSWRDQAAQRPNQRLIEPFSRATSDCPTMTHPALRAKRRTPLSAVFFRKRRLWTSLFWHLRPGLVKINSVRQPLQSFH